jgi:hypothetical protein
VGLCKSLCSKELRRVLRSSIYALSLWGAVLGKKPERGLDGFTKEWHNIWEMGLTLLQEGGIIGP